MGTIKETRSASAIGVERFANFIVMRMVSSSLTVRQLEERSHSAGAGEFGARFLLTGWSFDRITDTRRVQPQRAWNPRRTWLLAMLVASSSSFPYLRRFHNVFFVRGGNSNSVVFPVQRSEWRRLQGLTLHGHVGARIRFASGIYGLGGRSIKIDVDLDFSIYFVLRSWALLFFICYATLSHSLLAFLRRTVVPQTLFTRTTISRA